MAKKPTDKKKKGPKGKIARAKAKLDRQWGEVSNDKDAKKRVGRSRILSRRPPRDKSKDKKKAAAVYASHPNIENCDDDSESSQTDDDDEGEIDGGGAFYSKLLNTIRKTKGNHSDDDSEAGGDGRDENTMEEDEDGGLVSSNNNDMHLVEEEDSGESDVDIDDEIVDDNTVLRDDNFDPFGKRFSNIDSEALLPADEAEQEEFLRKLQQTVKISVPHVDPMLELQVAKELLKDMDVTDTSNMPKAAWKKLANQAFGCNRDVLKRRWEELQTNRNRMSSFQSVLYPSLTRYADCLVTCKSKKTNEQASNLVLLHIINHVLTSRGRIQRHNRKLKAMTAGDKVDDTNDNDDEARDEEVFKDQGYTRPTVLVLLPTRGKCHKFIQQLIHMVDGNAPEEYVERLDREYGVPPEDDAEADDDAEIRRKKVLEEKGASWQEFFGDDTNNDDDFKLGLALNAKSANVTPPAGKKGNKKENAASSSSTKSGVHVKLYTDFYSSDIIIASPLGLKMALASDTNDSETDYLSSIEICLVDRSDVLMMQNWDHVNDVLESVNQLPKHNNETDFSRVRNYFLEGQAANWRQTIVFSDIMDPAISSTFKRFAKSRSGVLRTRQKVLEDEGSIAKIIVPLRQVFQRIPTKSMATISDERMKYLTQKILPSILQSNQKHTMIYIPSYFDFVQLRNYLIKNDTSFVSITEYSRVSETSRGRARFLQGRQPLMLYTGRAHFFLRHKIKGIRNLIFYGLPEHSEFYSDLVNVINEGLEHANTVDSSRDSSTSSIALFTKYEAHALERIVGTKQSTRMIKGEKSTFMFLS